MKKYFILHDERKSVALIKTKCSNIISSTNYEIFLPPYQLTFCLAFGLAKRFFSYHILINILSVNYIYFVTKIFLNNIPYWKLSLNCKQHSKIRKEHVLIKHVLLIGHLEISASASRHQHRHWRRHRHRHCKNFFFLAKFLFLPFEVSYEENIYGEVLFKYPCTPSWEFQPLFRAVIL